jgi:hypothetical protein
VAEMIQRIRLIYRFFFIGVKFIGMGYYVPPVAFGWVRRPKI